MLMAARNALVSWDSGTWYSSGWAASFRLWFFIIKSKEGRPFAIRKQSWVWGTNFRVTISRISNEGYTGDWYRGSRHIPWLISLWSEKRLINVQPYETKYILSFGFLWTCISMMRFDIGWLFNPLSIVEIAKMAAFIWLSVGSISE